MVAPLILQLALLTTAVNAQQTADRVDAISPTRAPSSSRERIAEGITCAAGLTIAKCIASATERGKFTTFAKLTKAADVEQLLNRPGPYTVFLPTNEAFSALDAKKLEALSDPANRELLRELIYRHIVSGNIRMREVSQLSGSGATAISLQGMWLGIAKEGTVNGARILKADIEATNGTIHIVDTVILPDNDPPDPNPPPPEVVSTAPKNEQRTRTRVVKINSWPNEPVKIVSVKLRGGEQIKPGIPFPAVDDWVRGLTLTVTNVSKRPVCFIHVQLHLPRPADDAEEPADDALMFVCDPVTITQPYPLMPGMSMDITLRDSDYEPHKALLERNGYSLSISDLELKVLEVKFFRDKNRKWAKGQMMRQDPDKPGDWYRERPYRVRPWQ
ncbi:MAG TPA: fasciclin domain-containing protein [Pyrinomonadaceae bacterium]|jgi:uncharacterized surface protein with fasciclin (FAS1) repeats|nr:fasciclin domain-containing protein [Pyrinomonadaceae bacterium]